MITRPLDLEARLSPPPRDLNFVGWVNVGVIVLFFSLLGSRFVLTPGLPIGTGESGLVLPEGGEPAVSTGAASVVVSYRRENVILFEGGMYSLVDLKKQLAVYARQHPGAVMLVRADRQVTLQNIVDLIETARLVGFANVLLAAEPPPQEAPPK
ncbi:MAG TPA: biopolymer transporter ExbD [Planctomycetota bacterium]|jgi:biopolymer transport protein ExbD|nr:biopolymer transporter ExbD [Planctomycetota bacterium]